MYAVPPIKYLYLQYPVFDALAEPLVIRFDELAPLLIFGIFVALLYVYEAVNVLLVSLVFVTADGVVTEPSVHPAVRTPPVVPLLVSNSALVYFVGSADL